MSDRDDEDGTDEPDDDQDGGTTSWDETREGRPSNERNVAAFQRLMGAETRLYNWWEERQTTTTWVTELLSCPVEEESNLWIAALGERISAMGGHLELVAVFGDEALTLLREPGPETNASEI